MPLFYCAIVSLATAVVAAFLGFTQLMSWSQASVAQHAFLAAITTFVLASLWVVFDPSLSD